jgi:hypothetical protein
MNRPRPPLIDLSKLYEPGRPRVQNGYLGPRTVMSKPPTGGTSVKPPARPTSEKKD